MASKMEVEPSIAPMGADEVCIAHEGPGFTPRVATVKVAGSLPKTKP